MCCFSLTSCRAPVKNGPSFLSASQVISKWALHAESAEEDSMPAFLCSCFEKRDILEMVSSWFCRTLISAMILVRRIVLSWNLFATTTRWFSEHDNISCFPVWRAHEFDLTFKSRFNVITMKGLAFVILVSTNGVIDRRPQGENGIQRNVVEMTRDLFSCDSKPIAFRSTENKPS